MAKKYRAIYMPDEPEKKDWSKDGFDNMEEAEKYILEHRCNACKQYWDDPKKCSCRAEWDIEEYEENINRNN